jgi:hypothetical protein
MRQLAHVAGPPVAEQRPHRVGVEFVDRLAVAGCVLGEEVRGELRDIVAPLAQRRQADLDRVDAEQQVLTEPSRGDLSGDVGVGGGQDAHVDLARLGRADALQLARLQHAQQLRLLRLGEVGDLVEEQRATVGDLEAADAVGLGVGEGALVVAEQLALEHAFGEPAEVHGHEGAAGTRRGRVQPAGDDLLAGAVLPGDQGVGVGRADPLHQAEYGEHRGGGRDQLGRAVAAQRAVLALESLARADGASQLDLRTQLLQQPGVVPRFFDVVARAAAHRFDGAFDRSPGGHDEHGERGVEPLEAGEEVEAFDPARRIAGVVHVHQQGVEVARLDGG